MILEENIMNNLAISIKNITKKYKLYEKNSDIIKEVINPFKKSYHRDFYALEDISFDIKKGETVGILGENGAGKSTLLKIITGVLTQTSGSVEISGKIASLLELGAGFNPNLTGYENIYFNGTIMGLSNEEIDHKVDDILNFADIGEFIYQPVKSYSSGMFARLAFATAINVNPDILIVDEALSVGDVAFQAKCFVKFKEFQEQNKTILFVTHSIDLIIKYCQSAIILDRGKLLLQSDAKTSTEIYRKMMVKTPASLLFQEQDQTPIQLQADEKQNLKALLKINESASIYGTIEAEIIDFAVLNESQNITNLLVHDEIYTIFMRVKFHIDITEPIFAYTIRSVEGLELTGTNSRNLHTNFSKIKKDEVVTIRFEQKMILNSGIYMLALGCTKIDTDSLKVMHRLYDICIIEVISHDLATGIAFDRSKIKYEIN